MAEFDTVGNADLLATQQNNAAASGADPAAKPKDIFEFITQILEQTGSILSVAVGKQIHKIGNVGIFANVKIEQAGIQTGNNIMKAPLLGNTQGGLIAGLVSEVTTQKMDFSGIKQPPIEGIPIQAGESISLASLGELTPPATPSGGVSMGGMDMMA